MSHAKFQNSVEILRHKLSRLDFDRIFVVTDSNVAPLAAEYIDVCREVAPVRTIIIPAGEGNKNLLTLSTICEALSTGDATRRSLIVNIGGGMVSDMGGFAAAIFKRGIRHINVATTLLAAVDASIGGKTGIDFSIGSSLLKNELGAFHMPLAVIPAPELFGTLPTEEWLSGMGEVMKTAMLSSKGMYNYLLANPDIAPDSEKVAVITTKCAAFKRLITRIDPTEKDERRMLNLGHTAGHAFESLLLKRGTPMPHGVCVAHGLLVTLILSHLTSDKPEQCPIKPEIHRYRACLREAFPPLPLKCSDSKTLITLMAHDKKNVSSEEINFVLLTEIGQGAILRPLTPVQIAEALDIYFTF